MFKLFAASLALAATPVVAQAATQVQVRYGDLDLSNTGGMATLNARLARAANQVCAIDDMRDAAAAARAGKCRREALVQAAGHARLAMAVQQSRQAMLAARDRTAS